MDHETHVMRIHEQQNKYLQAKKTKLRVLGYSLERKEGHAGKRVRGCYKKDIESLSTRRLYASLLRPDHSRKAVSTTARAYASPTS